MPSLLVTRRFREEHKQKAISELLENTVPDRDYYLLVLGAVGIGICAIFIDSIAVLIASMIIAPLAYPILGLGLSVIVSDGRLAARSLGMLLISLIAAVVLAFFATIFFGHVRIDPVLISFSSNPYLATAVAVIAGGVAAYGLVRSKVGSAVTGIGIAVSLMPPLLATGIGIADNDAQLATEAFHLFLLNVVGIFAASAIVFALFGLAREYRRTGAARKIT